MNECCKEPENLELVEQEVEDGSDLQVRKCRVCGRRHFELMLDAGVIGLEDGS